METPSVRCSCAHHYGFSAHVWWCQALQGYTVSWIEGYEHAPGVMTILDLGPFDTDDDLRRLWRQELEDWLLRFPR